MLMGSVGTEVNGHKLCRGKEQTARRVSPFLRRDCINIHKSILKWMDPSFLSGGGGKSF